MFSRENPLVWYSVPYCVKSYHRIWCQTHINVDRFFHHLIRKDLKGNSNSILFLSDRPADIIDFCCLIYRSPHNHDTRIDGWHRFEEAHVHVLTDFPSRWNGGVYIKVKRFYFLYFMPCDISVSWKLVKMSLFCALILKKHRIASSSGLVRKYLWSWCFLYYRHHRKLHQWQRSLIIIRLWCLSLFYPRIHIAIT